MATIDKLKVKEYLLSLQNTLCETLEREDGQGKFLHDVWQNTNVITGNTRIITGDFIEHGAVNFSHVQGNKLPSMATARYPDLVGATFEAMGVSMILHPRNPYVPTMHANLRFFIAQPKNSKTAIWWFGGGYDMTPYYAFEEDCLHWHTNAYQACEPFGEDTYFRYKEWCDKYFTLPHRQEARGVGGLFFDDLNRWSFSKCFKFIQSIGDSIIPGYLPIVTKRKGMSYGERERDFQLYRRGRYVEFNLIYDRGTLFGLQSNGRTESILASLPPLVKWRYNWQPEANTPEAKLYDYLKPRVWLKEPLAL